MSKPVLQVGAGILMLGLALSASARDDSPSSAAVLSSQAATKPGTKATKSRNWLQVGVASWYGMQFQGRKTAGGEAFDMNSMTCAHPTLPMGTWLRVTNLRNRKTAFVRVNDRGPVFEGRIVDLSFAAARALGLAGVGKVKLETVRESDPELARALVAQLQVPTELEALGQ
jgi:rare lipoprotein A